MKVNEIDTAFSSKRTLSILPKFIPMDSKQSQNNKENDCNQLPSTKKYISTNQKEKQQHQPDQTQKFLLQTKNRLYTSAMQLQDFCKKKLLYNSNKEDLDYLVLSKEIKATKQKLRNKHQLKRVLRKQVPCSKVKSSLSSQKLQFLQKVLTIEQLASFQQQLCEKQTKIRKQYRDNIQMQQKLIRYYHNFHIIGRFLEEVAKDAHKLEIRKEKIELYFKMKEEMISLLSNEEFFTNHIKVIEDEELKREKTLLAKSNCQDQRYGKGFGKNKYNSPTAEYLMIERIQQLLETSKDNIKDAFDKFNRPDLMYEIQLQFNKRISESA